MEEKEEEETVSLNEAFANALPDSSQFTFHHLSTPPTRCDALFSAPAKSRPDRTYRESHLLLASINNANNSNDSNNPKQPHKCDQEKDSHQEQEQQQRGPKTRDAPVLAIEIIIYTTKHLTTLFVSKADSTGYLTLLGSSAAAAGRHSSPARSICTTFISYLVRNRRRPHTKLVVSLFARAQDQYLFPGSVDNGIKHVLDDRGLVKWWCKVLDPVIRSSEWEKKGKKTKIHVPGNADGKGNNNNEMLTRDMGHKENGLGATPATPDPADAMGYLIVPGFDKYELTAFFPPTWRSDPPDQKRWKCGHPLYEISNAPDALRTPTPPRCLIPHFPDDPKARFLTELDEEIPSLTASTSNSSNSQVDNSPSKKTKTDQWKSVKTLDQFWEMMAFRQECSSGRLVGFIWAVVFPADSERDGDCGSPTKPLLSPSKDAHSEQSSSSRPHESDGSSQPRKRRKRKQLKGPIVPRQPRIKSSSSSTSTSSMSSSSALSFGSSPLTKEIAINKPEQTEYYYWPKGSRGELVLSEKDYTRATEMLLRLDFSSLECARASFSRWTQEISVLARSPWGREVIGKKTADPMSDTSDIRTDDPKSSTIHHIIPLAAAAAAAKRQPLSTTSSDDNLKRKIEHQDLYHQHQPVNILSSGLVKKKIKKNMAIPTPTVQQ